MAFRSIYKQYKSLANEKREKIRMGVVIIVVAGIGVNFLIGSHAASPYASISADKGTLSAPAVAQQDSSTSDGYYVKFGANPSVSVKGDQLVDASGKTIRLLGVDASAMEYCTTTGTISGDAPLNQAEANGIAMWKANAVRIPLNEDCWLGINGVSLNGLSASASAQAYQAAVKQFVKDLNQDGIIAILDLHWSAPGTYEAEQQWPMADADHSETFWTQVATDFSGNPAVMYDLVNEPYIGNTNAVADTSNWSCWLNGCNVTFTATIKGVDAAGTTSSVTYATEGMQQLVDTIRDTGATQPIIVGGLDYSSDPCGIYNKYGSTAACPQVANMPTDPLNQLVLDYHNYVLTSTGTQANYDNRFNEEFNPVNAAGYPMVTDEFGEYDCATAFIDDFMNWADQNNQSYLAWSWTPQYDSSPTCSSGSTAYVNFALIGNWTGIPSTIIPQGADIEQHMQAVSPY